MIDETVLQRIRAFWMQERAKLGDPYRDEDYAGYLDDQARAVMPQLLDELFRLRGIITKQAVTIATEEHLHRLDADLVEKLRVMTGRVEQAEMKVGTMSESMEREQFTTWERHFKDIDTIAEIQRLSARNEELEIALRLKK